MPRSAYARNRAKVVIDRPPPRGRFLIRGDVAMPETVVHFQIRMPPVLHEQLASWAKEDKASLNALIVGILEDAIKVHEKSVAHKE
jgi:hypothetical protein